MGVPIRATMDTDCIGHTPEGVPVYFDHYANCADFTVSIARIKPHSSFRGKYESGMVKNERNRSWQAERRGLLPHQRHGEWAPIWRKLGASTWNGPTLLFCLGLMENAYDQTCMIRRLSRETISCGRNRPCWRRPKPTSPAFRSAIWTSLWWTKIGKNITGHRAWTAISFSVSPTST